MEADRLRDMCLLVEHASLPGSEVVISRAHRQAARISVCADARIVCDPRTMAFRENGWSALRSVA